MLRSCSARPTGLRRRDELGKPADPLLDLDQALVASSASVSSSRPKTLTPLSPRTTAFAADADRGPGCSWTAAPPVPPARAPGRSRRAPASAPRSGTGRRSSRPRRSCRRERAGRRRRRGCRRRCRISVSRTATLEHRLRGVDADDEAVARRRREIAAEVPRPAGDVEHPVARRDREHLERHPVLLLRPAAGQPRSAGDRRAVARSAGRSAAAPGSASAAGQPLPAGVSLAEQIEVAVLRSGSPRRRRARRVPGLARSATANGRYWARTSDLLRVKEALSQLS